MRKHVHFFWPVVLAGFFLAGQIPKGSATGEIFSDGPYIMYKNDQVFIKYIVSDTGGNKVQQDSFLVNGKESITFHVSTDIPEQFFTVRLKSRLKNEKAEYKSPGKLLILSDIEGNFKSFRTLLQANGVIDSAYNWTFGTAHLVLTGDFFDRGGHVTEVLWLIYSLEEKAKAAGGFVHFILGNHEIMNLSGDTRYVQGKYLENAALMQENYVNLYGENTELGRWLRTKNILERIGNMVFIHGGISDAINRMDISAATISDLARPYYPDSTFIFPDRKLDTIFGDLGPFWYRGYYTGNKATMAQIDSTLDKFHVNYIITGHTIVADTITRWYGGKVFNTDVQHAKGFSEAILKEGNHFYRVNDKGEKFPI